MITYKINAPQKPPNEELYLQPYRSLNESTRASYNPSKDPRRASYEFLLSESQRKNSVHDKSKIKLQTDKEDFYNNSKKQYLVNMKYSPQNMKNSPDYHCNAFVLIK